MAWELFDKMTRSFALKISIRNNGMMGFNRGTVAKWNLKDKSYCKLYYDASNQYVGFEFSNEEQPKVTAKLVHRGEDTFINAKSFLRHYEIDFEQTSVFLAQRDTAGGFIFIDLKNPEYVSTRGKRKK